MKDAMLQKRQCLLTLVNVCDESREAVIVRVRHSECQGLTQENLGADLVLALEVPAPHLNDFRDALEVEDQADQEPVVLLYLMCEL